MFTKRSAVTLPASPGSLLREKRTENGWSRADVAWALCLTDRQMQALESDDYQNLPGKTYILGYWKGYANLLGISIDHSIKAHKQRLPQRHSTIALQTDPQQMHGSIEKSRRRLAFLFGVLSVIFLASLWYWQHPDDGFFGSSQWLSEAQSKWRGWLGLERPAQAAAAPSPLFVAPQAGNGRAGNQHERALTDASLVVLPEPNFSEPPGGYRLNAQRGRTPPGPDDARPAPPAGGETALAGAPTQAAASPPEQIVVAVEEESWVDVHDGAGQRLIYRSVGRGQRLTLEGVLPFSVFIGNPGGVRVEYRGRLVPFDADRGGRFARFNIGAQ